MKYYNSDFMTEWKHLHRCPINAQEAHNKLVCLCKLEQIYNPNVNKFYVAPLSKRRERLVKMFWGFRKTEQNGEAATI